MAWRQPFRSGLREIAEGLRRKAQVQRAYTQVEQQLELQKGQNAANMVEGLTGTAQQFIQGMAQQPGEFDARPLRDNIANEIEGLQDSIVQMQAHGGDPDGIRNAQRLLVAKQRLLVLPDAQLPAAYDQTVTGFVVPPAPAQISATPGTFPGQSQWSDINPEGAPPTTLRGSGRTGAQVLSAAATSAAVLGMNRRSQEELAKELRAQASTWDLNNPASVLRAMEAYRGAGDLPEDLRGPVLAHVRSLREAVQNDPAFAATLDESQRLRLAQLGLAELNVDIAGQTHDLNALEILRRNRVDDLEFTRLTRDLDDDARGRVLAVLDTGVGVDNLDDAERASLGRIVRANTPQALIAWATGAAQQHRARTEIENAMATDRQRLLQTQIRVNEENVRIGELVEARAAAAEGRAIESHGWRRDEEGRVGTRWNWETADRGHTEWQQQREQYLVGVEDRDQVLDAVFGAAMEGDPFLLTHYAQALGDPESVLGKAIVAALGPDAAATLATLYGAAQTEYNHRVTLLEHDVNYRDAVAQTARLKLEQSQLLMPLETEALRAQYELDERAARRDLLGLEFADAASTITQLGEMAAALPSAFWQNLPPAVGETLRRLGFVSMGPPDERGVRHPILDDKGNTIADPGMFVGLGEHAEWVNRTPQRRQAWQELEFLVASPPTLTLADEGGIERSEVDEATMLDAAADIVGRLDLSPVAEAGLLSAVMSIWGEKDVSMRLRFLQMSASIEREGELGGDDMARVATRFSSLANSLVQDLNGPAMTRLSVSGCAIVRQYSGIDVVPRIQGLAPATQLADGGSGKLCGEVQQEWQDKVDQHDRAVEMERYWTNRLSETYGGPTTGTVNNPGAPRPAPTGNPNPTVTTPVDVDSFASQIRDWGGLPPMYHAPIIEAAKLLQRVRLGADDERDLANAAIDQLMGQHDRALLYRLFRELRIPLPGQP